MAKEDTKRAMSEAALDAKAKRQLATAGLGEKELNALKARYGARAYDLISAAMYPDNVRKALGWEKFKKSSATIKDFLNNPLTPEQIEKVTGKKADNTRTQATSLKSNSRDDTKATMKQQRAASDKARKEAEAKKKAADEKKRAEAEAKKKAEAERKAAQDRQAAQQREAARRQSTTSSERSVTSTGNQTFTLSNVRQKTVKKTVTRGKNKDKVVIFESSVTDSKGNRIPELSGATNGSITDFLQEREVRNESDPVGTVPNGKDKKFWGLIQCNQNAVDNMAIYSLTNPKYKKYADKFFNPGYEKALKDFNDFVKKNEQLAKDGKTKKDARKVAYWEDYPQRKALLKYRKPISEFKTNFAAEGKNNQTDFLQFQRDFLCDNYASQNKPNLKRIEKALAKKGMKPEDVNPAIWGMVLSSNVHYQSKSGAIAAIFERPNVDRNFINSTNMVDAIANTDPSTFKVSTGKDEVKLAKERIHEKNSATTCRELAMMFDNPSIEQDYLNDMAQNVVKQADGTYLAKANAPTKTASNNVRTNNTARM